VVAGENINIDQETLNHLSHTSEGDMRKGMNVLQSGLLLRGNSPITLDDIYLLTGVCHSTLIDNILSIIMSNNYSAAYRLIDNIVKT